jgi:hypothetical protein
MSTETEFTDAETLEVLLHDYDVACRQIEIYKAMKTPDLAAVWIKERDCLLYAIRCVNARKVA